MNKMVYCCCVILLYNEYRNSEIPKRRNTEMAANIIQVRKKGALTLPVDLRDKYGVGEGDVYTLIDLGDGSFLLTPRLSQVNRLGDRIAEKISMYDVNMDELLQALDDEREQYYRDHYESGTNGHEST
jgi:bifunctional DNA-binding transcriptional regulator/antitoxin component of YhaV-PrlF toxin-antitoxin module